MMPFRQKRILLVPLAMQRLFSYRLHFAIRICELREITVSIYNLDMFQIHSVKGILSEL